MKKLTYILTALLLITSLASGRTNITEIHPDTTWKPRMVVLQDEYGDRVVKWVKGYYNSPPANQPPVANAGSDQAITLPTSTVTLDGSATDADGTIASTAWSVISQPSGASASVTTPSSLTSAVTALSIAGLYKLQLLATDNNGGTDKDTMQVTVNAAPAGPSAQFNFNDVAQSIAGWIDATGNPSSLSVTDPTTGFGVSGVTSTTWQSPGTNNLGETVDDGGGFAIPADAVKTFSYNFVAVASTFLTASSNPNMKITGLDNTKTYTIELMSSYKANSIGGYATCWTYFCLYDYGGDKIIRAINSTGNTSHLVTVTGVHPDQDGNIKFFLVGDIDDDPTTGFGVLNGLIIEEESE